ncbi:Mitogen-activated protein kinase kinase kinase [Parasponia andersonii]|uniref:non-specific serine/threonine protein kinase n=1 Tax=Parasponia andersonii TaxID=3476 RepID=A0A2P5C0F9_PARAD|nr:Mitogen-activated protein kinase kinase kinase [Parasponia andersonii]
MLRHFHLAVLVLYSLVFVVHSQDQSGFISLDCGLPENSSYAEPTTEINYTSDAPYINSGLSKSILPQYKNNIQQQGINLRSFPDGIRNCYTVNTKRGTKYLIRASFLYGSYDAKNEMPEFDIHLGANFWDTVKIEGASIPASTEIIHFPLRNYVRVCLVNTGSGTPFISALELRPLKNTTYMVEFGSLALVNRVDVGSTTNRFYRYPADVFDRTWGYYEDEKWTALTTSLAVDQSSHIDFQPPPAIMSTAATPINASAPLEFKLESKIASIGFYLYLHFAELQQLKPNESRAFDVKENGRNLYKHVVPDYLTSNTIYSTAPITGELNYTISISKAENSTLPPILNAVEVYRLVDLSLPETDQDDVGAIMNIKSTYGVKRNWDGDPCFPVNYTWAGLNCSFDDSNPPRITSLNLSSSGLTGEISTYISDLTMLESLDLSKNSLTGPVPSSLSQLSNLRVLNLGKNKLTGSVPEGLTERSKDGSLSLSVEENQDLCESSPCKKKKTNIVVPIAASLGGLVILLAIAAALLLGLKNKKKQAGVNVNADSNFGNDSFGSKKRQFTYSEVVKITNNFERILGKGGFGTVYHGFIDDIQVAVKMLSSSSVQGFQQFQAEVKLLMRVYHGNLTSLVGYCNEGTNLALIYEYMANGSLDSHLSGNIGAKLLSWEGRLQIALDAAQGLEYLHSGCKPPIVHRDVKTANILLTENFQAKLADFGLSKFFPTDGGSHVSTMAAGTPGYLDPEYYLTSRLIEKSDVYSFGVVLLELITGQPPISRLHENERTHISQWAGFMLANGDVKSIVDPKLQGDFEINSVWKAVEIAMACVASTATRRPNMSQVVIELKECLASEIARKNQSRVTDSIDSYEMLSLNVTTELSPLAR